MLFQCELQRQEMHRPVRAFLAWLLVMTPVARHALGAQMPSPSVSTGFGVDTTITDVRNVVSLVRAYLAKPDSSARARGLWSTANEFDRRVGDVTAWQVNQGFPATVIGVISAGPGDSIYVVRILYAMADSAGHVSPLAMQRLYAVREAGAPYSFRLSGVFPRAREQWEKRSTGPLSFWYVPGTRPNSTRVAGAGRFVDSVARLFHVPMPRHLDVIVGKSMDETYQALGIDFFPEPSGPGVQTGGLNLGSIILTGNPAIGEAYYHEFVHSILGPSLPVGSKLLGEGVATWLGGSRGRAAGQMYALLRDYQRSDSTLSLSHLIRTNFEGPNAERLTNLLYASGALIADSIYRKDGIDALRNIYQAKGDPDSLIRAISIALGLSPTNDHSLDNWWRAETERSAVRN